MKPMLIPSSDYIAHVANAVDNAHKRIASLSLIFLDHKATNPLLQAFARAQSRGVDVCVSADFSSYSYAAGYGRPATLNSQHVQPATQAKAYLEKHGVSFRWLGSDNMWLIFAGRTHSKWIIVDDTVYSFGGMNVHERSTKNADFMLCIQDATMADFLAEEHARIIRTDAHESWYKSHSFDTTIGTVLIDGGFPGDSIIYDRACQLASQATKLTYISQYCPSGRLARIMKKTGYTAYYNQPDHLDPLTKLLIKTSQRMGGIDNTYTREPYIHAKYLIATMPDSSTRVITGSHNFATAGVWAGTREVALETSDPAIINLLLTFIGAHIV